MLIESAKLAVRLAVLALVLNPAALAQSPGALSLRPNLDNNIERPLRYHAEDGDFVIVNGAETFNRPLYGRNSAFRVDGGDRPEFVMYLPGRGGNLRLGVHNGTESKWLFDLAQVTSRYRPGELLYEIRDPMLGAKATLNLHVLALNETDGLVIRYQFDGDAKPPRGLELIAAFGGVNGQRGVRDGDIGTERVPISQWFQLQPEFCRDNSFAIGRNSFELRSAVARIAGVLPRTAKLVLGDARRWNDLRALLNAARDVPAEPVLVARMLLGGGEAGYFALQRVEGGTSAPTELNTYSDVSASPTSAAAPDRFAPRFTVEQLPAVFARTREHFRTLRERVSVETPDPFIDAAVGALNVAADALWDEPQKVVMHGAIAWRARLLGWRGPYAMDALGWHERARQHLRYWATRQNVGEIPDRLPSAEEDTHLARNPAALHSNGDLSNSHYDMNLVYIDALFRHLQWTADIELARETWPVIERHLAWERRLFRRPFGPEKLPLYEAYAAIWASDDLQYGGGGTAHASAYNWWHNVMAARVAALSGEDGTSYQREADLILRAMREYLWLPDQGMFAEYRDYLGLQRAHPAAALWSFYHVMDATALVGAHEAQLMTRYVKARLPRLPVRGPDVGDGHHVYATSNWMPYSWSINNVVMGENMHTALGFWQADDNEEAFTLFRSALLASMYMGISPGNVGSMNYLDVYRRESQRDFADGAGVMSRALVEGLFGIRPDSLEGVVNIEPGWPSRWKHASLRAPHVELAFRRNESVDRYRLKVTNPKIRRASFRLRSVAARARVTVAGEAVIAKNSRDENGSPWLEFSVPAGQQQEILVSWEGQEIEAPRFVVLASVESPPVAEAAAVAGQFDPVNLAKVFNDRVTEIFRPGKYRSPRSPFASLAIPSQGIGAWAGHVNASVEIDDSGLRRVAAEAGGLFRLPGGPIFATPGESEAANVVFTSRWDNYPSQVTIPLKGQARHVYLLMAGSTNHMQSQFENGEVVVEYKDGTRDRLALHNPTNWWPIDQDYFIDDFQFRRPAPIPLRVDLKTGFVRTLTVEGFKGKGGMIPGGAATVLELPLHSDKPLKSLTVTTLANEVVIGLMAATLVR